MRSTLSPPRSTTPRQSVGRFSPAARGGESGSLRSTQVDVRPDRRPAPRAVRRFTGPMPGVMLEGLAPPGPWFVPPARVVGTLRRVSAFVRSPTFDFATLALRRRPRGGAACAGGLPDRGDGAAPADVRNPDACGPTFSLRARPLRLRHGRTVLEVVLLPYEPRASRMGPGPWRDPAVVRVRRGARRSRCGRTNGVQAEVLLFAAGQAGLLPHACRSFGISPFTVDVFEFGAGDHGRGEHGGGDLDQACFVLRCGLDRAAGRDPAGVARRVDLVSRLAALPWFGAVLG